MNGSPHSATSQDYMRNVGSDPFSSVLSSGSRVFAIRRVLAVTSPLTFQSVVRAWDVGVHLF